MMSEFRQMFFELSFIKFLNRAADPLVNLLASLGQ